MVFSGKVKSLLSLLLCVVAASAHSAESTVAPLHLVFASDPQFPWTESSDNGGDESSSDRDKRSRWLIETQYADIANFRKYVSADPARVPVMINGDMTAFGHGGQRSTTKAILDAQLGENYDYGLGNHDYQNNVDDCLLNNCAAGSIVDFKSRYFGKLHSLDLQLLDEGTVKKGVFGSLAYSKVFGDVQLIQLHNEPTYSTSFTAYDWLVPTNYRISDSLDWLEQQLSSARKSGKIILLNMHKPNRWSGTSSQVERFRALIKRYEVTAVFVGHLHDKPGKYTGWNVRDYFADIPVFLSGGASNQSYLIASFTSDRKTLTVYQVDGNNWSSRKEIAAVPVR